MSPYWVALFFVSYAATVLGAIRLLRWLDTRKNQFPARFVWITRTVPASEPGGEPTEIRFLVPLETALKVGIYAPRSGEQGQG
jgi:hypothetical protein